MHKNKILKILVIKYHVKSEKRQCGLKHGVQLVLWATQKNIEQLQNSSCFTLPSVKKNRLQSCISNISKASRLLGSKIRVNIRHKRRRYVVNVSAHRFTRSTDQFKTLHI